MLTDFLIEFDSYNVRTKLKVPITIFLKLKLTYFNYVCKIDSAKLKDIELNVKTTYDNKQFA